MVLGNGVSMVANKYEGLKKHHRKNIKISEPACVGVTAMYLAELIRKHNNANILSLLPLSLLNKPQT